MLKEKAKNGNCQVQNHKSENWLAVSILFLPGRGVVGPMSPRIAGSAV